MSNILNKLWEIALLVVKQVDVIWNFLNTRFGFSILTFEIGFVPIDLISYSLITLVGFWFVKALIPTA
jgi:hypothetical protein